ncbi:MAG: hypothetical protein GWP08_17740, partial [Nitrospiraceae bacterium]|nr:hypothetical protein [Nitrospiraceae bacterium]
MATKSTLESLLDLAGKFVIAQKGEWEHADWEALLSKAAAMGIVLNDEFKRNLGNILESCKYFYVVCPTAPAKKAAARKAKAKAKPKP